MTQVHDHGYVSLIETWGSDERIIESARMSTQKGFEGWPQDERLLRYLYTHKHDSPFEFAGAVFEVQAPIFVFREWHRHRVFAVNEASARYAPLPAFDYEPTIDRLMANADGTNKQAGRVDWASQLTREEAVRFSRSLHKLYAMAQNLYDDALEAGVPKELARLVIPVGRYSRMRVSANLRNWMGFLRLRLDPAAQQEIRDYAEACRAALTEKFPRSMGLFNELG